MKHEKKVITGEPPVNNERPKLTDKETERLQTAYQQAFLTEQVQRKATNEAISKLRAAERGLREAAQKIAEQYQMNLKL